MKYKGKIEVELSEEIIKGKKLKQLIDFCFKISDNISLNSVDTLQMMASEIDEETKARNLYWEEQRRKIDEQLCDEDEEEAGQDEDEDDKKYDNVEETIVCAKSEQEIEEFINKNFSPYDFIKREVTYRTHCTVGPLKVVYYFQADDNIKQRFECMNDLYEPIMLGDDNSLMMDDPAFYKGEERIGSICSHEDMGSLVLEEFEYNEFRKFRIPHLVVNQSRTWSLEEWLEECAYQERESICINGWNQETIPEQVGKIKTLKTLQIFDHQVRYLPESLQELTELECLRITGNKVESLGFDISKLKKLKILDLCGMPLKSFPEGIFELKQLEKIYLGSMVIEEVPEALMDLDKLQVLSLPPIEADKLSPEFADFIKRLQPKPKPKVTSIRELLGEEKWKEIEEKGAYIMGNF
ncbi:MAG: leucine-rich repeat domain-containing protein [Cellulosilyticaceae bacterium]